MRGRETGREFVLQYQHLVRIEMLMLHMAALGADCLNLGYLRCRNMLGRSPGQKRRIMYVDVQEHCACIDALRVRKQILIASCHHPGNSPKVFSGMQNVSIYTK